MPTLYKMAYGFDKWELKITEKECNLVVKASSHPTKLTMNLRDLPRKEIINLVNNLDDYLTERANKE